MAGELRSEIIEAQKTVSDLVKWKLILVAGLGALQIHAVGEYLAAAPDEADSGYEAFLKGIRENSDVRIFGLERWVFYGSTLVLSSVVALVGVALADVGGLGQAWGLER